MRPKKGSGTMSAITIVKEIKAVHPEYVALTKRGGFYNVYGKDAIIVAVRMLCASCKRAGRPNRRNRFKSRKF